MHIIAKDYRKGDVKIKVEDADDLWYLSHIIDAGDRISGKTTRKMRIGDSENAKTVRKTFTLTIEAESVDYSPHQLRINGKIKSGPDDIPLDSYHSINLEEGSECKISKTEWLTFQKQKLAESSEKKRNYLLCLFDREEALFALTKKQGYKILLKLKGEVAKKAKTNSITKDFYVEIIKALDDYNKRLSPEAIILASPAFYKEDLMKKVNDKRLQEKIVLAGTTSVATPALDEVLKRNELGSLLKDSRARKEKLLVDELLSEISKDGKATYGLAETTAATNQGAVIKLLITDDFLQRHREAGDYQDIDALMKTVDKLKGEIHILSSEQEGGRRLDGLGGIASLLRYTL